MAGVDQLPVEMLSSIFIVLNAHTPNSSFFIAGVCKHWRTVVLGTPRAWCNLRIDLDRVASSPLPLPAVFTRSKPHPLDLQVVGQCPTGILLTRVLPELNGYMDRTRRLVVAPSQGETLEGILRCLTGPAPILEEIKANGAHSSWHATHIFGNLRGRMDKLRSVDLQGCVAPFPCPLLSTPLTHLRITASNAPISLNLVVSALKTCCNSIEHFSFKGTSHWDAEPAANGPDTIVHLPKLHTLHLSLDDATSVLTYLYAPSLRTLSLHRRVSSRNNQPEFALSDFLLRSSSSDSSALTSLGIDNVGMGPESWIRTLKACPNLESLTSRDAGFSDAVLHAMRVESLCPNLVTWITGINFSTTRVLQDFLRHRNPPRMRRTKITPHVVETDETGARVKCLRYIELHGCRPNDAQMRTIEFIMLASDPMRNGTFEHQVKTIAGM